MPSQTQQNRTKSSDLALLPWGHLDKLTAQASLEPARQGKST